MARQEHQTTSIFFIYGVLTKWYFLLSLLALVLSLLKTVSLALPGNSLHCLSSDCCGCDAWCTCHGGCVFVCLGAVCKLLLLSVHFVAQISAALVMQVIGVIVVWASGLETIVLALGETLLVVVLVVAATTIVHHGACAACIGNADGDDSCCPHIERMTLDSCAGLQSIAVCVHRARFAAIDTLAAIFVVAG